MILCFLHHLHLLRKPHIFDLNPVDMNAPRVGRKLKADQDDQRQEMCFHFGQTGRSLDVRLCLVLIWIQRKSTYFPMFTCGAWPQLLPPSLTEFRQDSEKDFAVKDFFLPTEIFHLGAENVAECGGSKESGGSVVIVVVADRSQWVRHLTKFFSFRRLGAFVKLKWKAPGSIRRRQLRLWQSPCIINCFRFC